MKGGFDQPCAEAQALAQSGEGPCDRAHRPWVLTASILGSAMVFIDGTALTVALPTLQATLNADAETLNWIVNAYVLVLAAGTLIGGAAADRYGRRRLFVIGAAGFGLASLVCGMADSAATLIAGRVLQGVFGAILAPTSLAMLAAAYPKAERGRAIGAWAGASALTTAAGPIVAGVLIEAISWHAIFFLNLPFAAMATGLAWRFGRETRSPQEGGFDLIGAGLAAVMMALFAYGLVGLGEGATSPVWAASALVVGSLCFIAFVWHERTTAHPMIPTSLFAIPAVSSANAFTFLAYAALGLAMFMLPLNLSEARGWSATEIGFVFLPFTLAVGGLSRFFGDLGDRYGASRVLGAGAVCAALGFVMMGRLMVSGPAWLGVFVPMGIIGIGFALFIPSLTRVAVSEAGADLEGVASGVNNAVARFAGLVGTALAAAALSSGLSEPAFYGAGLAALLGGGLAFWGGRQK